MVLVVYGSSTRCIQYIYTVYIHRIHSSTSGIHTIYSGSTHLVQYHYHRIHCTSTTVYTVYHPYTGAIPPYIPSIQPPWPIGVVHGTGWGALGSPVGWRALYTGATSDTGKPPTPVAKVTWSPPHQGWWDGHSVCLVIQGCIRYSL